MFKKLPLKINYSSFSELISIKWGQLHASVHRPKPQPQSKLWYCVGSHIKSSHASKTHQCARHFATSLPSSFIHYIDHQWRPLVELFPLWNYMITVRQWFALPWHEAIHGCFKCSQVSILKFKFFFRGLDGRFFLLLFKQNHSVYVLFPMTHHRWAKMRQFGKRTFKNAHQLNTLLTLITRLTFHLLTGL